MVGAIVFVHLSAGFFLPNGSEFALSLLGPFAPPLQPRFSSISARRIAPRITGQSSTASAPLASTCSVFSVQWPRGAS